MNAKSSRVEPDGKERADHEDSRAFDASGQQPGLLREFWDFLRHNKKWWLTPIILTLLVLGLFAVLTSTAFAPFIYTLF